MARQAPPKGSVTRGKLALIAFLGVILIAVVASNFRSEAGGAVAAAPADSGAPAAPTAPGAAGATPGKPTDSPFGDFDEDKNWTPTPVDKLVEHDPFDDGEEQEPETPHFDAAELNELRNAQDAIIFTADGQTVARVGDKEYRVGDVVGGLEIREISSAGIVLRQPD